MSTERQANQAVHLSTSGLFSSPSRSQLALCENLEMIPIITTPAKSQGPVHRPTLPTPAK